MSPPISGEGVRRRTLLAGLAALPLATAARADAPTEGRLVEHPQMASAHVQPRDVTVWLPPGYDASNARHPVLYMHDGENLFDGSRAAYGKEWGVDEHVARLSANGQIRTPIVVGVGNTPLRLREYVPADLIRALPDDMRADIQSIYGGEPLSDDYLRFMVEELKPFIDSAYRTHAGRDDTVVMGSSMGGLISLYATARYPDVFGGAGAISTHWPAGDGIVIDWLAAHLPDPATHKFYFDHGTAMLDAGYAPYQQRMDAVMEQAGFDAGRNWITRSFEGAEHSERAWRGRVDVPLLFLLTE